jgi:hypothetical protein
MLLSLGLAPSIGVSWLGLSAGNGSWFATAGLLMVVLSLGAGFVVYWMAAPAGHRSFSAEGGGAASIPVVFSGGDPMVGSGRVSASDFSMMVKNGLSPFYRLTDVDSLYLGLWHRLLRLCEMLEKGVRRLEKHAASAILIIALIVAGFAWFFSGTGGSTGSFAFHAELLPIRFGVGLACLALLCVGYAGIKYRARVPGRGRIHRARSRLEGER